MIRIAFDIGGTFTDFVLHDTQAGRTLSRKVPTTPQDPSVGVLEGLTAILHEAGRDGSDVTAMLHATTVATNAVLERKGAATGLITTEGFRDVLIIGRQKRYETYDLYIDKPKPLVQRRHIAEVGERLAADGSVVTALDMASVDRAIDAMVAAERQTVAVALLHAYANGEHERAIRERFRERAPDIAVSISSEVSPKFREYERTSTVVTNAYVMAMVDRYLERLETGIPSLDRESRLKIPSPHLDRYRVSSITEHGQIAQGMVRMTTNTRKGPGLNLIAMAALLALAPALSGQNPGRQIIQTPFGPAEVPVTAPGVPSNRATESSPSEIPENPSRPAPASVPAATGMRTAPGDRIQVDVVDGRISMTAEAVSLEQLLATLDRAYGTDSSVASHLRNRNMSVHFSDLEFDRAVRKIFEGQGLDYIVVGGERILVTAESGVAPPGASAVARTAPGSTVQTRQPANGGAVAPAAFATPNPFQQRPNQQPQQPVPQPFGQLLNQQGNQGVGQPGFPQSGVPQPGVPMSGPGAGQQQAPSSLFGNTSPTILDLNDSPAATPTPVTPGQAQPPQSPFPDQPRF